jgi:hypothetical protein
MQDQLDAFVSLISAPRFNTYLEMARGDRSLAFDLYRWNGEVAGALSWSMHFAEIAVRNGVQAHFTRRYGPGWTDAAQFRNRLDRRDADSLRQTFDRQAILRRPDSPTDDQIVADMSFGFWVSVLRTRYAVPFGWAAGLKSAFPDAEHLLDIGFVQTRLDSIRTMRNRVAHHEPIIHRGIARAIAVRNMSIEVIGWSNRRSADFLSSHDPLPTVLARDPRDWTRRT